MVLLDLPALPGDNIHRKFPGGIRGDAVIRDIDQVQINFLVERKDVQQPAKLEQKHRPQAGEEILLFFGKESLETEREVFTSEMIPQRLVFKVGQIVFLSKHVTNYFQMKLYTDLLSGSPFMNVLFFQRSLVTHGIITRLLKNGIVIRSLKNPPTQNQAQAETMDDLSPSSVLDQEEDAQEFFISNSDLKFLIIIPDSSSVPSLVESIIKTTNIQPGDEVSIKGTPENIKHIVKSISVPLASPLMKKVTLQGTQVSFKASNLVLHSKTVPGTDNQTINLRQGHRFRRVFWTKDRKSLLGVFFDDDKKVLFADLIDDSMIVGTKRPRPSEMIDDSLSKMRRLV